MANAEATGLPAHAGTVVCCRDDVLAACVVPQRRTLLLALALKGEQTGAQLMNYGKLRVRHNRLRLDSTLKHLAVLVELGLVVKKRNPRDGRVPLYALSPSAKVSVRGSVTELEFGTCMIRLKANGD